MSALSRFEGFMQEVMDGRVVRLFGGSVQPVDVARRLGRCMEERQTPGQAAPTVPNAYLLLLHPEDYASLLELDPALGSKLADYAVEFARERGFNFSEAPVIRLMADGEIRPGQMEVQPSSSPTAAPVNSRLGVGGSGRDMAGGPASPPFAWLVAEDGTRLPVSHVPFRIGRRDGNDLVLADQRVSRQHATIERDGGAFVLVDLESHNGTSLNGRRISRAQLRNGDRVAICDFEVIFEAAGS
ncbi:MAG: FHA domain-containing protein [Chloroflexota bacterium]|nr:FHA domain-containing protein [Chloroflexota bacterium]